MAYFRRSIFQQFYFVLWMCQNPGSICASDLIWSIFGFRLLSTCFDINFCVLRLFLPSIRHSVVLFFLFSRLFVNCLPQISEKQHSTRNGISIPHRQVFWRISSNGCTRQTQRSHNKWKTEKVMAIWRCETDDEMNRTKNGAKKMPENRVEIKNSHFQNEIYILFRLFSATRAQMIWFPFEHLSWYFWAASAGIFPSKRFIWPELC